MHVKQRPCLKLVWIFQYIITSSFMEKKKNPNKIFANNFRLCISLGKEIVSNTSLEAVQYFFQILFSLVQSPRCLHPGYTYTPHNVTLYIKLKSKDQVVIPKVLPLPTEISWTWKVLSSQDEEKGLVYLKTKWKTWKDEP